MSYSAIRSESRWGRERRVNERKTKQRNANVGRTLGLVGQIQYVCVVCSLQGADVVVLGAFQDFGQRIEVDSERHRSITAVFLETRRLELHRDERDVGVVHGLQVLCLSKKSMTSTAATITEIAHNAFLIALKIRVRDEFFDGWTNTLATLMDQKSSC
jgi:hypothetical protein